MESGWNWRIAAGSRGRAAAAIVDIRDFARPSRLRFGEDDGSRGEVLLFTGVRYERQIEPSDPVAGNGQGRRRRRR